MSAHLDPAEVPGLSLLDPAAPDRKAADEHAAGCPACRRALDEASRLMAVLEPAARQPPPSVEALSRAHAAVLAEWGGAATPSLVATPTETRPAALSPLLMAGATAAAWALTLLTARHHDGARMAGSGAGAAIAAAGALVLAARERLALAALGVASLALALAVAEPGPLAPLPGVVCLLHELGAALVPVAAAAWLLRSGRASPAASGARLQLAAAATAGGLAGQAALHVTCLASTSLAHLLAFHVGGVAAAALLASAYASRLPRPTQA